MHKRYSGLMLMTAHRNGEFCIIYHWYIPLNVLAQTAQKAQAKVEYANHVISNLRTLGWILL